MRASAISTELHGARRATIMFGTIALFATAAGPAAATGCAFEPQGEGRVAGIIDARSFRLQDGREVRLAGIEPVSPAKPAPSHVQALATMLAGRDVILRGQDDVPDRYGRQPAFVFLQPSETLVQGELLAQGEALVSATVADKEMCCRPDGRRGRSPPGQNRHLERSVGHKKHRKSGRYFGRDRAFCIGRRQDLVRPTGGGNHIPQLRAKLDTGFCCDYFKADATCFRGGRHRA
jgi:hypothetical protein